MPREYVVHPVRHGTEQSRKVPSSGHVSPGATPLVHSSARPQQCRRARPVRGIWDYPGRRRVGGGLRHRHRCGSVLRHRPDGSSKGTSNAIWLMSDMASTRLRVALFVTCLVDLHRPTVGFAALRLLEQAGCQVEVPRGQTCSVSPPTIPAIGGLRVTLAKGFSMHSVGTTTWWCHRVPAEEC